MMLRQQCKMQGLACEASLFLGQLRLVGKGSTKLKDDSLQIDYKIYKRIIESNIKYKIYK
jgi:hypothetical protein